MWKNKRNSPIEEKELSTELLYIGMFQVQGHIILRDCNLMGFYAMSFPMTALTYFARLQFDLLTEEEDAVDLICENYIWEAIERGERSRETCESYLLLFRSLRPDFAINTPQKVFSKLSSYLIDLDNMKVLRAEVESIKLQYLMSAKLTDLIKLEQEVTSSCMNSLKFFIMTSDKSRFVQELSRKAWIIKVIQDEIKHIQTRI